MTIVKDEFMIFTDREKLDLAGVFITDAHGLYEQFGWTRPTKPEIYPKVYHPDSYKQ